MAEQSARLAPSTPRAIEPPTGPASPPWRFGEENPSSGDDVLRRRIMTSP
jgi:hypothetical protein